MKKNKGCACGNQDCCNETPTGQGLEVKGKPFLSNDEWKLTHKRSYMEMWFDQYNHTMEFSRTIIQSLALILQLVILWKLFS